jgi:hypothetical protein
MNIYESFERPVSYLRPLEWAEKYGESATVKVTGDIIKRESAENGEFFVLPAGDDGLVINKPNMFRLADAISPETKEWIGQTITVKVVEVEGWGEGFGFELSA